MFPVRRDVNGGGSSLGDEGGERGVRFIVRQNWNLVVKKGGMIFYGVDHDRF